MNVCANSQPLALLPSTNFSVLIKKCPGVVFNATHATIPGFAVSPAIQGTPFVNIPRTGDKINYMPFTMTYTLDERLRNYLEIFQWINEYAVPSHGDQYTSIKERGRITGMGLTSDISMMPLDSSRNVIAEVLIKDAFPVAMSPINFTIQTEQIQYATATVEFNFRTFDILFN